MTALIDDTIPVKIETILAAVPVTIPTAPLIILASPDIPDDTPETKELPTFIPTLESVPSPDSISLVILFPNPASGVIRLVDIEVPATLIFVAIVARAPSKPVLTSVLASVIASLTVTLNVPKADLKLTFRAWPPFIPASDSASVTIDWTAPSDVFKPSSKAVPAFVPAPDIDVEKSDVILVPAVLN